MLPHQHIRRRLHRREIQRPPAMPHQIRREDRAIRRVPDGVLISLAQGRTDRVERIRNGLDRADKNILGQRRVDRGAESVHRDLRGGRVEMDELSLGVHAGIGAGGTDAGHRMPDDRDERLLQLGLNRRNAFAFGGRIALPRGQRRLLLPAVIARTAVGEGELVALGKHVDNRFGVRASARMFKQDMRAEARTPYGAAHDSDSTRPDQSSPQSAPRSSPRPCGSGRR